MSNQIQTRLSRSQLEQFERFMTENKLTASQAARVLIAKALEGGK